MLAWEILPALSCDYRLHHCGVIIAFFRTGDIELK